MMKSALITLLGMAAVQAVEVVEIVGYQTANCSSSERKQTAVPLVVANNGCHTLYGGNYGGNAMVEGNISVNAMCSNGVQSVEAFSFPDCEGTPQLLETCYPGSTSNGPAIGIICADLPDDDVIVLTIGDTCVRGDISTVSRFNTLVVNQCLPNLFVYNEMQEITISSSNVMTYNVYSGTSCTGSPVESYIGPFGSCFTATATTGTVAIKAEPAVAGVQTDSPASKVQTDSPASKVQTDSPASKVNGDLISLLLVVIAAVFIGA